MAGPTPIHPARGHWLAGEPVPLASLAPLRNFLTSEECDQPNGLYPTEVPARLEVPPASRATRSPQLKCDDLT